MQTIIQKNKLLPKDGHIDSLFDRLVTYVSDVDKEWVKNVKPASKESIDHLVKVSKIKEKGFDLPKSYRILLENLGEDDGGILSKYLLIDTSITEICDYYEEENEIEPESINPEMLVIGLFNMGGQLSLDLKCPGGAKVIISDDGEFVSSYSENLEKFLFQNAFIKCEKMRYPEFASYGGSENMLRKALEINRVDNIFNVVEKYAVDYEFTKAWFSDQNHYLGLRDDASFMVEMRTGMIIVVCGKDKKFVTDFGEKLSQAIGATYKFGTID
ncbi:MAG: hypothetical protein GY699_14975 [Desulfobacteraceae bacterium]|nr:hypothetical protein [Desulfobacteraceae bacterium]